MSALFKISQLKRLALKSPILAGSFSVKCLLAASLLGLPGIGVVTPAVWAQENPTVDSTPSSAMEADSQVLETITLDSPELDTTPATELNAPPFQESETRSTETPAPAPNNGSGGLVINTTKLAMPLNQVGGSVSVIPRSQIQRMQATSIMEVLRQVPGVDVIQNGGPGGTSSIFIRGANAEHTLVMVDGIRINDPISPTRAFNYLDQLSMDTVERVEILRGPQGPLYGSESMGGVINVITRSGEGRPKLSGRIMAGSYGTLQEDISLSGGTQKINAFLQATRQDIRGFSAAGSRYGNPERDGFHNTNLHSKLQFQPLENLSVDLIASYNRARFDLDNFGGYGGDDPNHTGNNRMLLLGGNAHLKLFNNRVEQIAKISLTDQNRRTWNGTDSTHPFDRERSRYNSQLLNVDVFQHLHLHRTNTLTVGMNLQHEKGDSIYRSDSLWGPYNTDFENRSATNLAFYAQDTIRLWDRWFTTLGMRSDHHDRFGHFNTYRAATSFLIRETGTSLKASYGTGFKAPTLYQLFSMYGDPNLTPETSQGWDAGVEQALLKNRVQLGATFFQNRIRNLIQFNPMFLYENIDQARTKGIESYATVEPFRNLLLRASYTYTDTQDLSPNSAYYGQTLLRRPRNKFSFNLNYRPTEKLNINVDVTRIGERSDLDFAQFPAARIKLAAVTLVNVVVGYNLTQNVHVFAKLMNLLDRSYEMTKGYGSPRIAAYGGLRLSL